MAKPGQRIVKGMLPEFGNLGKKPKPQSERGACERCGQKPGSGKSVRAQTIGRETMKVCDDCSIARNERTEDISIKLSRLQQKAIEDFNRRGGKGSMVDIKPRRKRGR